MARERNRQPKPAYTGQTINVGSMALEQKRAICQYVSKRTVYSKVGASSGQAFGSLIVGGDRVSLSNLGGHGMWWEEVPGFEAANPAVVAATSEWIEWFLANRGRA